MYLIPIGTAEVQGQAGSSWRGRKVCRPAGWVKQGLIAEKAATASHNLPVDPSQAVKRKLIPSTKATKSLTALPFASFKQLLPVNLNVSIRDQQRNQYQGWRLLSGESRCSTQPESSSCSRGRSWQRKLWSRNDFHWPGRRLGQGGGKYGFAPRLWVEEKRQRGTEKFPRGIDRGSEQGQPSLPSRSDHLHTAGLSAAPGILL